MVDGVEEFVSGDRLLEDVAQPDHPQDEPITWWSLRKSVGWEQYNRLF